MVNDTAFPSSTGFQIEFDYRMAGGVEANDKTGDGMSVYLIDGEQTLSSGGSGAGLAYANGGVGCGVTGGYFGVGLDVYGNYASNAQQNTGGPGTRASTVGLRGSGEPCSTTATYPWVTGPLSPGSPPRRRVIRRRLRRRRTVVCGSASRRSAPRSS